MRRLASIRLQEEIEDLEKQFTDPVTQEYIEEQMRG